MSEEGKTQPEKEFKCYICGGLHSYNKCLELKSLGAILRERKEQKAHKKVPESREDSDTAQVGVIGL